MLFLHLGIIDSELPRAKMKDLVVMFEMYIYSRKIIRYKYSSTSVLNSLEMS